MRLLLRSLILTCIVSNLSLAQSEDAADDAPESCIGLTQDVNGKEVPMCSVAGNDHLVDLENESSEQRKERLAEFYQFFEVNVNQSYMRDIKIQNKYCDDFSQEDQDKLSDWYNNERIKFCEKHNEKRV